MQEATVTPLSAVSTWLCCAARALAMAVARPCTALAALGRSDVGMRSVRMTGVLLLDNPERRALVASFVWELLAPCSSTSWACRQFNLKALAAFKNLMKKLRAKLINKSQNKKRIKHYSESDPESSPSSANAFGACRSLTGGLMGAARARVLLTMTNLKSGMSGCESRLYAKQEMRQNVLRTFVLRASVVIFWSPREQRMVVAARGSA